jgi:esterase/lipase superfamily enzyme
MRRELVTSYVPSLGREMNIAAYGSAGIPVLVFPSSEGKASDYAGFGMVDALATLIEAGRLRLYCVDSYDSESWYGRHRPTNERAWRHSLYENWIMNDVVPAIARDVRDPHVRLVCTGCSFGAFHSTLFALKHPKRFKHALAMSGVYDIRFLLDGHHDDWVYYNNPAEFVPNLHGSLLQELQRTVFITLVCGQGQWEEKCLSSTKDFWGVLSSKRIPNYMDLWGHDVAHDWPWWRKQIVYYMNHLVEGRMPWPSTLSA